MFNFIKKGIYFTIPLYLAACAADESAFLHPKLYYPEVKPPVFEKDTTPKVIVFGQSFQSSRLGMATFMHSPTSGSAYYSAFISSAEDIPQFYAQCKTIGNSHSGYSYVTAYVPAKKYEFGKYYQVSCEKVDIKHYKFLVQESDKATYEKEMSGGKSLRHAIVTNAKGDEKDATSTHFYAPKTANTQRTITKIIDPFRRMRWADNMGTDLHLRGDASVVQVECFFPQENGSSLIDLKGAFLSGHSYELACSLDPNLTARVTFKEINNAQ